MGTKLNHNNVYLFSLAVQNQQKAELSKWNFWKILNKWIQFEYSLNPKIKNTTIVSFNKKIQQIE